jgi:hypothetical protein
MRRLLTGFGWRASSTGSKLDHRRRVVGLKNEWQVSILIADLLFFYRFKEWACGED